tara:strand:- start:170 stop:406 length:237 start_codon:yes stop_codon:yes gene_type:complete
MDQREKELKSIYNIFGVKVSSHFIFDCMELDKDVLIDQFNEAQKDCYLTVLKTHHNKKKDAADFLNVSRPYFNKVISA